ncbi:hypothetical protein QBC38DRAFT_482566 [Podospora fimiseda]|uniref:Uncharacterized protein n=1 Tax=Podospora fimiseda TaxID=252190 RepID=A0AAN7BLP0_9PEZI|nr:hypothetical protein QBC38DRAFT_482566 [Podospora fimiseda]
MRLIIWIIAVSALGALYIGAMAVFFFAIQWVLLVFFAIIWPLYIIANILHITCVFIECIFMLVVKGIKAVGRFFCFTPGRTRCGLDCAGKGAEGEDKNINQGMELPTYEQAVRQPQRAHTISRP